jgi:hypothetical protein
MYILTIVTIVISLFLSILEYKTTKATNQLVFSTDFNTSRYIKKNVFFSKTNSSHSNLEELEKLMIGICHQAQSQILICKACYESGNTYCPYPTDTFCQQARYSDADDANIVWGWLPGDLNSTHKVSELIGKPETNPKNIRVLDDLNKAGVYRFNHTITYHFYNLGLVKYTKPDNSGADPCSFDGIVHY